MAKRKRQRNVASVKELHAKIGQLAMENDFLSVAPWTRVKYENVYLKAYDSIHAVRQGLTTYFEFYK